MGFRLSGRRLVVRAPSVSGSPRFAYRSPAASHRPPPGPRKRPREVLRSVWTRARPTPYWSHHAAGHRQSGRTCPSGTRAARRRASDRGGIRKTSWCKGYRSGGAIIRDLPNRSGSGTVLVPTRAAGRVGRTAPGRPKPAPLLSREAPVSPDSIGVSVPSTREIWEAGRQRQDQEQRQGRHSRRSRSGRLGSSHGSTVVWPT